MHVQVGGRDVDLIGSAIGGRGITQCIADPCTTQPCANGGTCTSNSEGFTCLCSLGFAGSTCNMSKLQYYVVIATTFTYPLTAHLQLWML